MRILEKASGLLDVNYKPLDNRARSISDGEDVVCPFRTIFHMGNCCQSAVKGPREAGEALSGLDRGRGLGIPRTVAHSQRKM